MTTRIMNCGVCNQAWEIPAEQPDGTVTCPQCNAHICACGCGKHLGEMRADSRYFAPACRTALERGGWASTRAARAHVAQTGATVHPLAEARAEQEASALNRRYGLLIRQAIIDRLKTTGTCHADDLEPLYPADELARKRCRKLAGAQFGSLASPRGSKEPLIREKERRKSSIPERKCAKSGVYEFTKAGWDKYGRAGVEGEGPRSSDVPNNGPGHSLDSGAAGLTGPGSGAGVVPSEDRAPGFVDPPATSTASPDKQLAGVSAGCPTPQGEEGLEETQKQAGAHSGETRIRQPDSGIGVPSPQGSGGAILPCSSADTALPDDEQPELLSLLPEPNPESWAA